MFVLAACGGSTEPTTSEVTSAVSETADSAVTDSAEADDGTTLQESSASVAESLAGESGSAVVTIGGQTYEFSLAGTLTIDSTTYVGRCLTWGGSVGGNGYAADGSDITLNFEMPPLGWEDAPDEWDPPSISVEDNPADIQWDASQWTDGTVTSFEVDDTRASGTATFVNMWAADGRAVEGTFQVDCS